LYLTFLRAFSRLDRTGKFQMIEPSELVEQFRAHAARCRRLARLCPHDLLAAEMNRIADDCLSSANQCESDPAGWSPLALKA
jgi:hypothetical protein